MNTLMIQPVMQARCQALQQADLLTAESVSAQASEALDHVRQLHITDAALQLSQLNTLANMWGSINHTYSNSYLQKTASDNLCQSAMSAFTASGEPRALNAAEIAGMFALSNGIAPSNGVELAYTDADNTVQSRMLMAAGFGFQAQHCFYQLLNTPELQLAFARIFAQPENNRVPTLILHGQADGTVAINHASRAYYHQNQSSESANQQLRYYEIEHVQHFDAFLAYPGFNQQFVPMHPYFEQALELMYMHLFENQALPPSQLIKTQARGLKGGQVPALNQSNIPTIAAAPQHEIKLNQQQLEIQ
jgi:hydroxybutyrate-dimer hydrolase